MSVPMAWRMRCLAVDQPRRPAPAGAVPTGGEAPTASPWSGPLDVGRRRPPPGPMPVSAAEVDAPCRRLPAGQRRGADEAALARTVPPDVASCTARPRDATLPAPAMSGGRLRRVWLLRAARAEACRRADAGEHGADGTSTPGSTRSSSMTPSSKTSTSMSDFSVSTTATMSPRCTVSPGRTRHSTMVPASMSAPSEGIRNSPMSGRPQQPRAAATMAGICGRAASSRCLAYGMGTSALQTRATGASRS